MNINYYFRKYAIFVDLPKEVMPTKTIDAMKSISDIKIPQIFRP